MSTGVDIPVLPPVAAAPRGSDRALRACCVVFIAAISAWSSLLSGAGVRLASGEQVGDLLLAMAMTWFVVVDARIRRVSLHYDLWLIAVVWCVYVPVWLIWTRR